MIHPRDDNSGGYDARDGRDERVAVQLCRLGGAHPRAASAAQDPAGSERRAGQLGRRVRGALHRFRPPLDPAGAADPGEPDPDTVLGPVRAAVDGTYAI